MSNTIEDTIADLARLRRIELSPGWAQPLAGMSDESPAALASAAELLGWTSYIKRLNYPKANQFPLIVYRPEHGWGVAELAQDERRLSVVTLGVRETWPSDEVTIYYDVALPETPAGRHFENATAVFIAAIAKRKHSLVLAVVATVVINLIALGTSIYSMQVYDRVIPRGSFSTLWVLTGALIVALLFDFLLRVIRARLLEREAMKIDSEVSEYFFSRANEVRLDARPPSVGTMAAQLRGLDQIRSTMSSAVVFAVADLPFALFFIYIVWLLGGVIASVMLISFPLSVAIALLLGRLIRSNTEKSQISSNRKNGLLVEAIDAAETIKSNRGQWYFLSRWNTLVEEVHESDLPVKNTQSVAGSVFGSIQQFAYVAVIAWGALEVYEHRMTQGALIACSILAGRINGPLIGQLPGMIVGWTYTKISLGMLDGIMRLPTSKPHGGELLRPSRLRGEVELADVKFAYQASRMEVSAPKLKITRGERVGVIGPIGSGKSTLLKLMGGLFAPAEGRVLIDGLDIGSVSDDIVRQHVGYLAQDFRLVNGSLRDNLLMGLHDPGDDAIMAAANLTGLASLIAGHPQGIDLQISEGGRGLSGGQRVLVGLTRLFLAKPGLWLLDEPTSNLDGDTEMRIFKAMQDTVDKDETVVIVTHKPQLLKFVDRLLVMANGQIMMDGPVNEILAKLQPTPVKAPQKPAPNVQTVAVGGVA